MSVPGLQMQLGLGQRRRVHAREVRLGLRDGISGMRPVQPLPCASVPVHSSLSRRAHSIAAIRAPKRSLLATAGVGGPAIRCPKQNKTMLAGLAFCYLCGQAKTGGEQCCRNTFHCGASSQNKCGLVSAPKGSVYRGGKDAKEQTVGHARRKRGLNSAVPKQRNDAFSQTSSPAT